MNEGYALRHLRGVMGWSFEEDNRETTWLRMMSDFKYDSYRDFWAGARFAEALLDWIQQFEPADRQKAYSLVRHKLIFLSFTEMEHLVGRTLPVYVHSVLVDRVVEKTLVPKYLIWSNPIATAQYHALLKRTMFVGLSDGARIDGFRRSGAGTVSNEQVVFGYEMSDGKWLDMHEELKKATGDANALFEVLFLIDDFMGSGKSLLRKEDGNWKGKLKKLAKNFDDHKSIFAPDCAIAVHHYVGTEKAEKNMADLLRKAETVDRPEVWFPTPVKMSFDLLLDTKQSLSREQDAELDALLDKYYDPAIETKSIKVGQTDAKFGFASCGLPLILEHNTPNNSLALLWAESPPSSSSAHRIRPLFRRRQRHS